MSQRAQRILTQRSPCRQQGGNGGGNQERRDGRDITREVEGVDVERRTGEGPAGRPASSKAEDGAGGAAPEGRSQERPHDRSCVRAKRQADANLPGPQPGTVRDDAEDPDRRQGERHQGRHTDDRAGQTGLIERAVEVVAQESNFGHDARSVARAASRSGASRRDGSPFARTSIAFACPT